MNWKTLAFLSLALNVVLAAWLVGRGAPHHAVQAPAAAPVAFPASVEVPVSSTAPVPVPAPKTSFHWSQVESADYLAYIANLRRIGCPEATIRDIIVADVNQLFAPRYAALGTNAPELAWWGRFDKRKPVRTELAVQLRALDQEKKALLTRLLGLDAAAGATFPDSTVAAVREQGAFAFLPEDRRTAVRDLVDRYEVLREWSEAQWKGLPSDERDAKEKELRAARQRELAALLTPDELREFDLRDSPTADALREQYGRANLAEAEFRTMYELRRGFEAQNPEAKIEDWKRLESQYAAALGAERYADLQRQNDAMWRAMQSAAAEDGYSNHAMLQAYAIKREYTDMMVQAVGRMFADPRQDPQPLRELAAEMEAKLAGVLGPETTRRLDRLGALPRLVIQDDGLRKSYSLSRGGFTE